MIRNAGADYVIGLKQNQKTMYEEFLLLMDDISMHSTPGHYTIEKGHGRIETRKIWVTQNIGWFEDLSEWKDLKSICFIESKREMKEKTSIERRLYISSLVESPKEFLKIIRNHWHIENKLHWRLDTQMNEDRCRARTGFSPENLSTLRHIALNIMARDNNPGEMGLHERMIRNQADITRLKRILEAA